MFSSSVMAFVLPQMLSTALAAILLLLLLFAKKGHTRDGLRLLSKHRLDRHSRNGRAIVPRRSGSALDRGLLEETLRALKHTTIAVRASQPGAHTLRMIWQVKNPFVSGSHEMQQAYRTSLFRLFKDTDGAGWTAMASATSRTVQSLFDAIETDGPRQLNVREASSHATLAAMFQWLFGLDAVPMAQLAYVGHEIHRLTVAKKAHDEGSADPDYPLDALQRDVDVLISELRPLVLSSRKVPPLIQHLLFTVSGPPDDFNPLNLLLPAFEAPWRGVLYTLLAVLQPSGSDSRVGSGVNVAASRHVRVLMAQAPHLPPEPEALAIVYESLRLYPPIRRVRRDGPVDVEAVQRHPVYWGPDPLTFRPARFLRADGQLARELTQPEAAWLPFAVGHMRCPTAGGFSARLLVVVVGQILQTLFADASLSWQVEGSDWDDAAALGKTLRPGREEYGNVRIIGARA